MLDAYIIDDIRRRPQREEDGRARLRIELPHAEPQIRISDDSEVDEEDRGPIIIPLTPNVHVPDETDDAA